MERTLLTENENENESDPELLVVGREARGGEESEFRAVSFAVCFRPRNGEQNIFSLLSL